VVLIRSSTSFALSAPVSHIECRSSGTPFATFHKKEAAPTLPGNLRITTESTMVKKKLKLDEVQIESFETATAEGEQGTVAANEMITVVGGTCRGQTGLCTACPPVNCY
jgi:hypothetical protein